MLDFDFFVSRHGSIVNGDGPLKLSTVSLILEILGLELGRRLFDLFKFPEGR